jgi:hypothetical protein
MLESLRRKTLLLIPRGIGNARSFWTLFFAPPRLFPSVSSVVKLILFIASPVDDLS